MNIRTIATGPNSTPTGGSPPGPRSLGLPAWLLIASLPTFAIYVFVAASTMPVESVASLTRSQADALGPALVAMNLLWTTAFLLGAIALLLTVRRIGSRGGAWARAAGVAAVIGGTLIIAYLGVSLALLGSQAEIIGDDPLHTVATLLSVVAAWALLLGTGAVSLALRRAGVFRVGGIVFAAIAFLYLLVEVVTWVPALLGAAPTSEGGGLPPFLVGVLWTALGIALLRRRVSSGV